MNIQLLAEVAKDLSDEEAEKIMNGKYQYQGKDVFLIAQTDREAVFAIQKLVHESTADILWTDEELSDEIVDRYGLSKIDDWYVNDPGVYYRGCNSDLLSFVKSLDDKD